jgi:glycosyltransferase involved in cell wall biosynthesis
MKDKRLLSISTDRLIFDRGSAVYARQVEYAKQWDKIFIIIFTKKSSNLPKEFSISDNCKVFGTNSISRFLFLSDAIRLGKKIIANNSITEIVCQDSSFTAMVGTALKRKFNIPLEIQVHGDIGSPYFSKNILDKIRLKLSKKYLLQADKIRVVSNRIKVYVEKLLDSNFSIQNKKPGLWVRPNVEVRPIFVDRDLIKNSNITSDLHKKYNQFDRIALMASRLEKEKDIELAINAWPKVLETFPNSGLIIVGNGKQLGYLKNLVLSKGLGNSIIFENWVDKQTLYSYYKTTDLFLNTSMFEGYGMTLVEAEAAGSKIVSTDVGVANEVGALIVEHDSSNVAKRVVEVFSKVSD